MVEHSIKLVYVGGAPFWRLPGGNFREAEIHNGRLIEPGLRLKSNGASLR